MDDTGIGDAVANLTIGQTSRRFLFRPKSSDEGVIKQIFVEPDRGNFDLLAKVRSPTVSTA